MRGHFWPFTRVQNGNQCEVTRKMQNLKNHGLRGCRGCDPWLASDTDALQLDARFDAPGLAIAGRPTVFYLCYPCDPWSGKLFQLG